MVGLLARLVAKSNKDQRRLLFFGLATTIEHWSGPKLNSPVATIAVSGAKFLAVAALNKVPEIVENLIEDQKIDPSKIELDALPAIDAEIRKGWSWFYKLQGNPAAVLQAAIDQGFANPTAEGGAPMPTDTDTDAGAATGSSADVDGDAVVASSMPQAPPKPSALEVLSRLTVAQRTFLAGIETLASKEVMVDDDLGLEGIASQVLAAQAELLLADPEGLQKILPDSLEDAKRLIELGADPEPEPPTEKVKQGFFKKLSSYFHGETPVVKKPKRVLPESAQVYIRTLLAVQRGMHPPSMLENKGKDWLDRLNLRLPTLKRLTWPRVFNMLTSPLGVLCMLTISVVSWCVVNVFGLFTVGLLLPLMDFVQNGIMHLYQLFANAMNWTLLTIQQGVVTAWLTLVLLPVIFLFNEKLGKLLRPRIQTIRLILSAVGLGTMLLGWGLDWINDAGSALFMVSVWIIIVMAEFTNKYNDRLSAEYIRQSLERFPTWASAIATAFMVLAVGYFMFVGKEDAQRVSQFGTGVFNVTLDTVAGWAGVDLPPSAQNCAEKFPAFKQKVENAGMSVTDACELAGDRFPCTCPQAQEVLVQPDEAMCAEKLPAFKKRVEDAGMTLAEACDMAGGRFPCTCPASQQTYASSEGS
ncbi:MAG: hypothetical protein WAZ14_01135 [Patescibacteria group bacterium]